MVGHYAFRISFGLKVEPSGGDLVVIQSSTFSIDPTDKEKLEHVCLDFVYDQIHNPYFMEYLESQKSNPKEDLLIPVHLHPVISQYVDTSVSTVVQVPVKPVIERMESVRNKMLPAIQKQKTDEARRKTMWG